MNERNVTEAHPYLLRQADQLLAARATGILARLVGELDTLRKTYPDIFKAEAQALHAAIQGALSGIALIEEENGKEG